MSFIRGRLRRLEEHRRGGPCPECRLPPDGPGRIVYSDGEGYPEDPNERCSGCGRPLWFVIEVVEEGEGSLLGKYMYRY